MSVSGSLKVQYQIYNATREWRVCGSGKTERTSSCGELVSPLKTSSWVTMLRASSVLISKHRNASEMTFAVYTEHSFLLLVPLLYSTPSWFVPQNNSELSDVWAAFSKTLAEPHDGAFA